jgi:hypothetical protein
LAAFLISRMPRFVCTKRNVIINGAHRKICLMKKEISVHTHVILALLISDKPNVYILAVAKKIEKPVI